MSKRYAVIWGWNGPSSRAPLRWARADAERLSGVLAGPRYGFEVFGPREQEGQSARGILEHAYRVADGCTEQDTFLVYFAGHGVLDRGRLRLFTDDTDPTKLLSTAIPAENILTMMESCRSLNKLVILDCCHAAGMVSAIGTRGAELTSIVPHSETFLLLMASGKLEQARELEELEAGFLTHELCSALTSEYDRVARDGRLTLSRMVAWLASQAVEWNQTHADRPVPLPVVTGSQRGEFCFDAATPPWSPLLVPWPDASELCVLPFRFMEGLTLPSIRGTATALALARNPVCNRQYRAHVEWDRLREPVGEHFAADLPGEPRRWVGPFYPWRDPRFDGDDLPVVCVDYFDAAAYCMSVDAMDRPPGLTLLPPAVVWDAALAASLNPDTAGRGGLQAAASHFAAQSPRPIDSSVALAGALGLSDLIGNVWEWCNGHIPPCFAITAVCDGSYRQVLSAPLRGGGFLDDIGLHPDAFQLVSDELGDRLRTAHTDLGFRIAALIPLVDLPIEHRERLSACPNAPEKIISAVRNVLLVTEILWGDREHSQESWHRLDQQLRERGRWR